MPIYLETVAYYEILNAVLTLSLWYSYGKPWLGVHAAQDAALEAPRNEDKKEAVLAIKGSQSNGFQVSKLKRKYSKNEPWIVNYCDRLCTPVPLPLFNSLLASLSDESLREILKLSKEHVDERNRFFFEA